MSHISAHIYWFTHIMNVWWIFCYCRISCVTPGGVQCDNVSSNMKSIWTLFLWPNIGLHKTKSRWATIKMAYLTTNRYLGLSLLGGKSYHRSSGSLEDARFDVLVIVSIWNLTWISTPLLLRCLWNVGAIRKVSTQIARLRTLRNLTFHRLVNRDPGSIIIDKV